MANLYNVALAIQNDVVTVHCTFGEYDKEYTFVCTKAMAANLSLGDKVVAQTAKHGFSVVTVQQVDDDIDIDIEANFRYCWIVDVIYTSVWEDRKAKTEELVAELKRKQRARLREQLVSQYTAIGCTDEEEGETE